MGLFHPADLNSPTAVSSHHCVLAKSPLCRSSLVTIPNSRSPSQGRQGRERYRAEGEIYRSHSWAADDDSSLQTLKGKRLEGTQISKADQELELRRGTPR